MSQRQQSDYERILRAVVDALPSRPTVQVIVANFERAVWAAVLFRPYCLALRIIIILVA